jgi:long-chain acyl-CoA synthetase
VSCCTIILTPLLFSLNRFHTGDLGQLDDDGWLRVTGRIKEQYKLENGKYVAPAAIEMAISSSRFIFQVVLCGANRPYNIALIVPDWETIRTELQVGNHVSELELADDERVRRLIDGEIASCCAHRKKFEIPVKWAFVAPFTAANKMLTPKMSIRRHRVVEAYEDLISHFYGEAPVKDLLDNSSAISTHEAA